MPDISKREQKNINSTNIIIRKTRKGKDIIIALKTAEIVDTTRIGLLKININPR
jgi:hypothetical protein